MDNKSKKVIELNGKPYDSASGTTVTKPTGRGKNMDGFFRVVPKASAPVPVPTQHVTVVAAPAPAPQPSSKPQRGFNHAHAHKPETPKTLMRTAVKKPTPGFKQQATVQGSLQHKVPSLIASKPSASHIDPHRLSRASNVARSPHIARHQNETARPIAVNFMPLQVQAAPNKPDQTEPAGAPAPQPTNKPLDIFEHAIANAGNFVDLQAHRTHFKRRTRRHIASMAAGTFALLVIAGFAAYQNTPGLQFKVASLQAGIATRMPNFQATGFAYNGVRAADGKLTVGLKGNGATYQLIQQTTNWSDQDMIQNISSTDAGGNPDYSTISVNGTAVYKLANDSATWVSDGKWYQVTGTNPLNDTQLKSLVSNT
jgi:hypothetical protein